MESKKVCSHPLWALHFDKGWGRYTCSVCKEDHIRPSYVSAKVGRAFLACMVLVLGVIVGLLLLR